MATAHSAILVENFGVTGLLYISDTSYPNHQQILVVLLQFLSGVYSYVISSIIPILVHTSFVLNDSSCLRVGLCLCPCPPTPIVIYSIHSSQSDPFKVLVI